MPTIVFVDIDEQWGKVEIGETLAGRRAGGSAAEKARELRAEAPVRAVLSRLLRVHTDERAWQKGANGERMSRWWLGRLPEDWEVLDDIPVGERGANIDHLVVGPAGVFTVNAKNLKGHVWVGSAVVKQNGRARDHVKKAAAEAERASRLLSRAVGHPVRVKGVVSILADTWTIADKPDHVHVGSPRGVKDWLMSLLETLTRRQIVEIVAAAQKPSTWRGGA